MHPEPQPLATRLVPASFPHPVERLELHETAISWLVLTGRYVYKLKKPLHLEYLDAATLERRHFLCDEELRLNRRFAPELYLDVLPISETADYPVIGDARHPIDYAVRMRQFERSEELSERLRAGTVASADMASLGARLAGWHDRAAVAREGDFGSLALVRSQVLGNFAALRVHARGAEARRLESMEAWCRAQLQRLAPLIDARQRDGRVRECHGDLHAGNVVHWQAQWLPFDCLEFEPRLRWIDVMSDVAFLFMDLSSGDHADLAFAFLSAWLEQTGDYAGLPLLSLYGVYRALVRAKVDALAGARQRQHRRIAAAQRLQQERRPALILMHGVSGSGKSWLSGQLVAALGAVRVRSDLERRRLLGEGAHCAAADDATYRRLYECAESALAAGLPVILDATFLEPLRRQPYRELSRRSSCPLLLIDCQAPLPLLESRIAQRRRESQDPSEADLAVLHAQLAAQHSVQGEERAAMLSVDTSAPAALERLIDEARARLRR